MRRADHALGQSDQRRYVTRAHTLTLPWRQTAPARSCSESGFLTGERENPVTLSGRPGRLPNLGVAQPARLVTACRRHDHDLDFSAEACALWERVCRGVARNLTGTTAVAIPDPCSFPALICSFSALRLSTIAPAYSHDQGSKTRVRDSLVVRR